jgi:hypothetical protein
MGKSLSAFFYAGFYVGILPVRGPVASDRRPLPDPVKKTVACAVLLQIVLT